MLIFGVYPLLIQSHRLIKMASFLLRQKLVTVESVLRFDDSVWPGILLFLEGESLVKTHGNYISITHTGVKAVEAKLKGEVEYGRDRSERQAGDAQQDPGDEPAHRNRQRVGKRYATVEEMAKLAEGLAGSVSQFKVA